MKTGAKDKKLIGEEWVAWWLKSHRPDLLELDVNKNKNGRNTKRIKRTTN